MLPNAYSDCLFNVTVSDMKSRSAHAFMCVMVVVVVCAGGCVGVHGVGSFYCNRLG